MKGIVVNMTEKVYFSNNARNVVKNDFFITIYKESSNSGANTALQKGRGETYPAIYIKGFEQFFKDDGRRDDTLSNFLAMFNSGGNDDWSIRYGAFPHSGEKCAVITCAADPVPSDLNVLFRLSDKCRFTAEPAIDTSFNFDIFVYCACAFPDIPDGTHYRRTVRTGFAVYIDKFGAYRAESGDVPLSSVYKGETCAISWLVNPNEKASTFLYDDNGAVVANLPPYQALIDTDKRFTLNAYNDYCSVSQSLIVRRTLWKKQGVAAASFPAIDGKGQPKMAYHKDRYFLYVHPKLYASFDMNEWEEFAVNDKAPAVFKFYSCAFNDYKAAVTYTSDNAITYCETNIRSVSWKAVTVGASQVVRVFSFIPDDGGNPCVILQNTGGGIMLADIDMIEKKLCNMRILPLLPGVAAVTSDTLYADGKRYIAVLGDDKRAYFYSLDDSFKNNVFDCPAESTYLYVVKTNIALYVVVNGAVFEAGDREKFSGIYFYPPLKAGSIPIIGASPGALAGVFESASGSERTQWLYQF